MNKYTKTVETLAVEWQPGVALPNAVVVEFPASITATGTFPAHALVVIFGQYTVLFPGSYVVYPDGYSYPIGVSEQPPGQLVTHQPVPSVDAANAYASPNPLSFIGCSVVQTSNSNDRVLNDAQSDEIILPVLPPRAE